MGISNYSLDILMTNKTNLKKKKNRHVLKRKLISHYTSEWSGSKGKCSKSVLGAPCLKNTLVSKLIHIRVLRQSCCRGVSYKDTIDFHLPPNRGVDSK